MLGMILDLEIQLPGSNDIEKRKALFRGAKEFWLEAIAQETTYDWLSRQQYRYIVCECGVLRAMDLDLHSWQ